MRLALASLVLLVAPVVLAEGEGTSPPCETAAEACADVPGGAGTDLPSERGAPGDGPGESADASAFGMSTYLPWLVLSIVLVGALVAALGYTVRDVAPDRLRGRRD